MGSMFAWVAAWAVLVYDGAFPLTHERVLSYEAKTIWPWLVEDENRSRWTAELVDLSAFDGEAGEIGAARLLFWRRGSSRWHAVEHVTSSLSGRFVETVQKSDYDRRTFKIELVPEGICQTKVIINETIRPEAYKDRFWFFRYRAEREERLEVSLSALDGWIKNTAEPCNPAG